jgi:hypothetical protein
MRFPMVFLVLVFSFTSGCVVLDPQRRGERKEHRHQLRKEIIDCARPGPFVWGGAHPIPQPPSKPYDGPNLSALAPLIPALLTAIVK